MEYKQGDICINRCKTSEEQRMLLFDGFNLYNKLLQKIKREENLLRFRRALVKYIKQRSYI